MQNIKINWLDSLRDESILIYGLGRILRKLIEDIKENTNFVSISLISNHIDLSSRAIYYAINNKRPISIKKFLILIEISNYNLKDLSSEIEKLINGVATGSGANRKIIQLPFVLTQNLSYFLGYLLGDGCLKSKEWTIFFVDEYKEQIQKIQDKGYVLFGIKGKINHMVNQTELYIYSKSLWLFFNKLFEIPSGKKKEIHIPQIIQKNPEYHISFLQGFVDADGGLCRVEEYDKIPLWCIKKPQIEVSSKSKTILSQLQNILKTNDIRSNIYFHKRNKSYRLIIGGKENILKARNLKIFKHPIKIRRLEKILFAPVA